MFCRRQKQCSTCKTISIFRLCSLLKIKAGTYKSAGDPLKSQKSKKLQSVKDSRLDEFSVSQFQQKAFILDPTSKFGYSALFWNIRLLRSNNFDSDIKSSIRI